ncbi:hypothetical protein AB9K26_11925 [Psychroserpens sp. XS_ASV72]|uniref:hypothetical protein n=1 Tax=Psychroserpens sp. XS_ASV72 TaxID=3241293 RepID=UPI003515F193
MKTLKKDLGQSTVNTFTRIIQTLLIVAIFFIASEAFSQSSEVEFEVYTNSASKASRYLMADDVALRDCPSVQCEQLTTIGIGTNVRLLAKSERPHTINGITSRWYKVKMGPQIGWIWGGLISQKTMVSHNNPEVKFVFGEAGFDFKGNKLYQVRAIKNGVQLDKMIFKSDRLSNDMVALEKAQKTPKHTDVIVLSNKDKENNLKPFYITFKDNVLKKSETVIANTKTNTKPASYSYVFCTEDEN